METTPEVLERASEFVADRLLELANQIGTIGRNQVAMRNAVGFAPNPAYEVQEIAARMLFGLALKVATGQLALDPIAPTSPEPQDPGKPPTASL